MATGVLAVVFTWVVHEFTHWLTSESFGYGTMMYLNKTSFVEGENPTGFHMSIISISAPLVTVLQAFVFFTLLKKKDWNKYFYPFLFTAFYMRVLAGFMNFINVNDEGRVSQYLEIGTFTLPIVVGVLLFFMVYRISKKHTLTWKFQVGTYLVVMVASSVLILLDQFFAFRLL